VAKPRLDNWIKDKKIEGLLFFAQILDEMLFDYTLDSYKPPVFNSHSMCIEMLDVIDGIEDGFLQEKSLNPIKEEFIWNLENDPIVKKLLGNVDDKDLKKISTYRYRTRLNHLNKTQNFRNLVYEIENLKNLFDLHYFDTLKRELSEEIQSPKNKKNITTLARIFLSELIFRGYSQQFLYYETRNFFFSQDKKILSTDQLNEFFSKFTFEFIDWVVIFKGEPGFKFAKGIKLPIISEISENIPETGLNHPTIKKYLIPDDTYPFFLSFQKIQALDPYSASERAEYALKTINNLAAYTIHKECLNWFEKSLVYSSNGYFKIVDYPVAPITKVKDSNFSELHHDVDKIAKIFQNLDNQSTYYILNSLNSHYCAIHSTTSENQLMNLWTAMETLLPPQSEQRILHFLDSFDAFLNRKYVQKLIIDLLHSLRSSLGSDLDIVFDKFPDSYSDFEKCAALISIQIENEKYRDEIYTLIKGDPLLTNKIYTLMKKLSSSEQILKTIELHNKRVRWQLQRIYRARNLIVHKGEKLVYINQLVENLHSYYHTVFDLIQEIKNNNESIDSLEMIFYIIKIDQQAHLSFLKDLNDSMCDNENFRQLLFGTDFTT